MPNPMEQVTLRNGGRQLRMLVNITLMTLESFMDRANPNHKSHEGEGAKAISWMLALYDLIELCKGEKRGYMGDCTSCFGGNRQKLLDSKLVEGDLTGPLHVRPEMRDVVLSALTFDMENGGLLRLDSPYPDAVSAEVPA